jgi:hypothetical protein
MEYESIPTLSKEAMERAHDRGDPAELQIA